MAKGLSASATKELRRELGAHLFFAMPRKNASEAERMEAWQRRVRPLLHCIDIIDGTAEPENDSCDGCGDSLPPDTPRHTGEDCALCAKCTPEGYAATDYGYRLVDADADIARARGFAAEMTRE